MARSATKKIKSAKSPKKKPLAKKVKLSKSALEFSEGRMEQLIEKGRGRGFITYAEILGLFPHIEDNIIFLDDLYKRLEESGVYVLEGEKLDTKKKNPLSQKNIF